MTMDSVRFENGRRILGCYLPAGDPAALPDQAQIYLESGVDFIEFGLPCADPFLDGGIIKAAMTRACNAGISLERIRQQLMETRAIFQGKPIVVVSYGNFDLPGLCHGDGEALFDAHLDLSDLPATRNRAGFSGAGFPTLPSVGFVSNDMGVEEIEGAREACGYVLLQAAPGKTGPRPTLDPENRNKIKMLRASGIGVPILLAIGISTVGQVSSAIELGADGVIIGTCCLVESGKGAAALREFLVQVRCALDAAG